MDKVYLKIKRKKDKESESYWEEFELNHFDGMTVIQALQTIQKNPVNVKNEAVAPVCWQANCLQEMCGTCTILINGKARPSCSARFENLGNTLTLEPMQHFEVVKDLIVDLKPINQKLKKAKAWLAFDGTHDVGRSLENVENPIRDLFQSCILCGACMEACPQVNSRSNYMGPMVVAKLYQLSLNSILPKNKKNLEDALMQDGGIDDCGNAQNCVKACPKEIPLLDSLSHSKRVVTKSLLSKIFG